MPNTTPLVYIVMVNFNGYKDTIEGLESMKNVHYDNYKMVIVDNGSQDNSIERLVEWAERNSLDFELIEAECIINSKYEVEKKIVFIRSKKNGGYAYGSNLGIKLAIVNGADYILVMNNDIVVSPDFLEPLVEMCERDDTIGIVSGKIYFYNKPNVIWSNGGAFNKWTGKLEHFNFNEFDIGQLPQKEISFLSGCMWLIPRQVFEKIGLINEEYFMYMEDLEFCYRVLKSGYKLAVNPESKIWHKIGSSVGLWSKLGAYWTGRNKIKFILENITGFPKLTSLVYQLFYTPLWWALKGRFDLAIEYIKGAWKWILKKS